MVNELNTAESTHETMFNEINKRITDPEFLETTVKNSAEVESEAGNTIVLETEGSNMSDDEARAYLRRYPDVGS
jgi:hypothetical protein